jgi:response regulator of citrate/malate metabolism
MSIANQIEQIGRALTAEELAKLLSVSRVTIFKQAAAATRAAAYPCKRLLPAARMRNLQETQ